MLKGAMHIHSTYSDGEFTLAELREIYMQSGCSFACVTDHAEAFDEKKLATYRGECKSLSDSRFLFVAGLEYSCEQRMHILGYGVTSRVTTQNSEAVIEHIEREEGISVIAHPKDAAFPWIESFKTLPDGVEVWNSKYDGKYAPRIGTFDLAIRLQKRKPEVHAFYGQDLHWKKQYRELYVRLQCETLERGSILGNLKAGRFTGLKGSMELPSDAVLSAANRTNFARSQRLSSLCRRFAASANNSRKKLGLKLPDPLKAQLRKLF